MTPNDGCQNGSLYSINAQLVYIAQGDTEEDLKIAFYEGDKCPLENAVATGNVGACLSAGGAYQHFDSYNAFPIILRSKRGDSAESQINDEPLNFQHGTLFKDDDGVGCKTRAMMMFFIPECDHSLCMCKGPMAPTANSREPLQRRTCRGVVFHHAHCQHAASARV